MPEVVREKFLDTDRDSAPVVRIQRLIFEDAISQDASDIHIEPRDEITVVRFRINGLMKHMIEVPRWMHENLVARIKILAGLDISERRVPHPFVHLVPTVSMELEPEFERSLTTHDGPA